MTVKKKVSGCTKRVRCLYLSTTDTWVSSSVKGSEKYWYLLCAAISFAACSLPCTFYARLFFCQKWCFMVFCHCPKGPLGLLALRWPKFVASTGLIVWCTMHWNSMFNAHMHPAKLCRVGKQKSCKASQNQMKYEYIL